MKMVRTGIVMDLIGLVLIVLIMYLIVVPVFGITICQLPAWAG
jgi:hypothetical protein